MLTVLASNPPSNFHALTEGKTIQSDCCVPGFLSDSLARGKIHSYLYAQFCEQPLKLVVVFMFAPSIPFLLFSKSCGSLSGNLAATHCCKTQTCLLGVHAV